MKLKSILYLFGFLFSFQNLNAQQLDQFAVVEIDSIENFLFSQFLEEDSTSVLIRKQGKVMVNIFFDDFRYYHRLIEGGCASAQQIKIYETYLKDFQTKMEDLEKFSLEIEKDKDNWNQKYVSEFSNEMITTFAQKNNYHIFPKKGILFHNKNVPNTTLDLISYIQNSKEFPEWVNNQKKMSDGSVAIFYLQILSIRRFFKTYKYEWVRKKWS